MMYPTVAGRKLKNYSLEEVVTAVEGASRRGEFGNIEFGGRLHFCHFLFCRCGRGEAQLEQAVLDWGKTLAKGV